MTITFVVLACAILLLLSDRVRPDLVALLAVLALGVGGVLTSQEVFSGFSRSAVITILAVYILAEGLHQAGVTSLVGRGLLKLAGSKNDGLVIIVMLAGATLSLFMNNIAAASVMLPAVSGAARKSGASMARLLMPLAFSTLLGGMATLLTTSNIVVSALLRDRGLEGFGLLDFLPVGIPVVLAGIVYMAIASRRILPGQSPAEAVMTGPAGQEGLAGIYRLDERIISGRIPPGSILAGRSLNQSGLRQQYNLNVIAVERRGRMISSPGPEFELKGGDKLVMEGRPAEISAADLEAIIHILPDDGLKEEAIQTPAMVMLEAVLAPRSGLYGKTLQETHFREKYQMNVLAIWRGGRPIRTSLANLALDFGDALLLQGPRSRLAVLRSSPDFILLGQEQEPPARPDARTWLALAMAVITLGVAASGVFPVGEVMLGGALLMVLAGVIGMDQAYQAVEWKSIFLVAGMLPMGVAMTKTGAAALLASQAALLGAAGPYAVLAGLFGLTILLSQAINGAAVAVIMAPIALDAAAHLGVEPRSMAMAVALAASMTFITPLGHPVNILVMGPGGYKFRDYFKVGLPLTILLAALVLALLPLFWPL